MRKLVGDRIGPECHIVNVLWLGSRLMAVEISIILSLALYKALSLLTGTMFSYYGVQVVCFWHLERRWYFRC